VGAGAVKLRPPPREIHLVVRITVCAAIAWQISLWAGASQPPVFAALVPLVAIKDDPYGIVNLSLARLVGVVAGIGVGLVVVKHVSHSTVALVIILLAGFAVGVVIRVGGQLNTQVAVSALLLVASPLSPTTYGLERFWETLVGAAVTVAVAPLIFPPDPLHEVASTLERVTRNLVADLRASAGLVGHGSPEEAAENLERVTAHTREALTAPDDVARARRALAYNPIRARDRSPLERLSTQVTLASKLAFQSQRMAQDVAAYATRDDLIADWQAAGATVPQLTEDTAEAARLALRGDDPTAAVARAEHGLAGYREADPGALAVILRRPLRALLDELVAAPPSVSQPAPAAPQPDPS
jgi:uncharacterized membrane protein YgaE (UPF0421/DUF939 family)